MKSHKYIAITGFLVFLTWIDILVEPWEENTEFDSELLLFYVFLIQLLLWGWSLAFQIYVWDTFSVNHLAFINYKISVRKTCFFVSLFALASLGAFGLPMHGFVHMSQEELEFCSFIFFIIIALILVVFIAFSTSFRWWSWKILQSLVNLFGYPWLGLNFGTTHVASMLTSATSMLWHFELSMCFFYVDNPLGTEDQDILGKCTKESYNWHFKPAVYSAPYIIRVFQNLYLYGKTGDNKRLWSTLKYVMGLAVIYLSTNKFYHPTLVNKLIWVAATVVKTVYSWFWDVVMDWNLWHKENRYLRKARHFPDWMYYFIMVYNLGARFAWTTSLGPEGWKFPAINLLFAGLEIIRRTFWCILKVEAAVLNNPNLSLYENLQERLTFDATFPSIVHSESDLSQIIVSSNEP